MDLPEPVGCCSTFAVYAALAGRHALKKPQQSTLFDETIQ
jgi:hypothetical protein